MDCRALAEFNLEQRMLFEPNPFVHILKKDTLSILMGYLTVIGNIPSQLSYSGKFSAKV